MSEWTEGFEHASITDANRESFNTAMGKYETVNDAVVGGFNAIKMTGKPFKMPESMEKLPDDTSRSDFTAQAYKLLGIEHAADVAGLADVDLKAGLAEGGKYDEDFANAFKQWAVDNKIPKSLLSPIAKFFNTASAKAKEALITERETEKLAKVKACNDDLVKHTDFGSQETVDKKTVLLHRALLNNVGITSEEANGVAEFLKDREGSTNPVIRRILINALSPLAASSSNEGGGAGTDPKKQVDPDEGSPSYVALGYSKELKK